MIMKTPKMAAQPEPIVTDLERLAESGFRSEEMVALVFLQQWYQRGGSDRMALVRHWEFLKFLVLTGTVDG
jgi:hypothetical protein